MNDKIIDIDSLLVGIDSQVTLCNGKKVRAVNFDNAATTPPFKSVLDSIRNLSDFYGSIGRGEGQKSEFTTEIYHKCRKYILDFFNIKDKDKYTVVYVNNTTDGMNKLAKTLIEDKNDIVISTRMEHHSNDLPWRRRCTVKYLEVDNLGRINLDELESKLIYFKGKVKYVTVTGASNVTGYVNDIHEIAKITHKYGAKIIIDGAQLVPHYKVDMWGNNQDERIDYLVFSAHKLYAPFGAGAIVGLKDELNNNLPDDEGGGTVDLVMDSSVIYLNTPEKDEAGTPNFFGVVAMVDALRELDRIGFDNIHKNEVYLRDRIINGLIKIPNIINYGDIEYRWDRLGIIVFNIKDMDHHYVANKLAKNYGIAVRQGWFCSHPYCRRLMGLSENESSEFINDKTKTMPGMIRASFGIYNKTEEVDYFLDAIDNISRNNKK